MNIRRLDPYFKNIGFGFTESGRIRNNEWMLTVDIVCISRVNNQENIQQKICIFLINPNRVLEKLIRLEVFTCKLFIKVTLLDKESFS